MNIITEIFVAVAAGTILFVGTQINKFFSRTIKGKCFFKYPNSNEGRQMHDVIIKKRFFKIKSIDCGWHELLTKNDGFQGLKYPLCHMAESTKDSPGAGKCKFYK